MFLLDSQGKEALASWLHISKQNLESTEREPVILRLKYNPESLPCATLDIRSEVSLRIFSKTSPNADSVNLIRHRASVFIERRETAGNHPQDRLKCESIELSQETSPLLLHDAIILAYVLGI